jgi:hypothetical protein
MTKKQDEQGLEGQGKGVRFQPLRPGMGALGGAGIIGGALLSAMSTAEGAIVYSGIQNVPVGTTIIDIDGGGNGLYFFIESPGSYHLAKVGSFGAFIATTNAPGYDPEPAVNFAQDAMIGAGANWGTTAFVFSFAGGYGFQKGQFDNETPGYMGVRFNPGDGVRYGWVYLDNIAANGSSYRVVDWAYESDVDTAIAAGNRGGGGSAVPEPSGLALLACGAAGIWALRRKRQAGADAAE